MLKKQPYPPPPATRDKIIWLSLLPNQNCCTITKLFANRMIGEVDPALHSATSAVYQAHGSQVPVVFYPVVPMRSWYPNSAADIRFRPEDLQPCHRNLTNFVLMPFDRVTWRERNWTRFSWILFFVLLSWYDFK